MRARCHSALRAAGLEQCELVPRIAACGDGGAVSGFAEPFFARRFDGTAAGDAAARRTAPEPPAPTSRTAMAATS
jgi:hypothetical protein